MKKANESESSRILKPARQASIPETLNYALYFLGQNLIYWMITNNLLYFYTDYAKITPLAVSVIFLVAKVWDAINDPIFGMIVDRTHFKKGKFVPWVKISSFLLPLATVLVFSIPSGFSPVVKVILAFVTYAIWDILYTVSDVPIFALSTVMTSNIQERSSLITLGRFGAMGGSLGISLAVPYILKYSGMFAAAVGVGIAALITMLPIGFIAKERAMRKKDISEATQPNHGFKEIWQYLKGNKYLLYFFSAFIISGIFKVTFANFVAENLLGGIEKISAIAIAGIPPTLLVYAILPAILKRVDRMTIYRLSIAGAVLLGVVQYFVGYKNFTAFIVVTVIKAFIEGFATILMFTFSSDAVEYGHYKTGIRKEGITFSLQTFSSKFATAIAGVITSTILALVGYSGGEVFTPFIGTWIWAAHCFLPAIGSLLSLPLLIKYTLRVKDVQVMAAVNLGQIPREDAQKMLSREY